MSSEYCPICGDATGRCEISGWYICCHGMPQAQKGELKGFWKCFRAGEEFSEWEDQRASLEFQYQYQDLETRLVDSEGNPPDFKEALDEIFKKKFGFGGGES